MTDKKCNIKEIVREIQVIADSAAEERVEGRKGVTDQAAKANSSKFEAMGRLNKLFKDCIESNWKEKQLPNKKFTAVNVITEL